MGAHAPKTCEQSTGVKSSMRGLFPFLSCKRIGGFVCPRSRLRIWPRETRPSRPLSARPFPLKGVTIRIRRNVQQTPKWLPECRRDFARRTSPWTPRNTRHVLIAPRQTLSTNSRALPFHALSVKRRGEETHRSHEVRKGRPHHEQDLQPYKLKVLTIHRLHTYYQVCYNNRMLNPVDRKRDTNKNTHDVVTTVLYYN